MLLQDKALEAYEYALSKQAGLGSKIDLRLSMIRVGFFHADYACISSNIDKAKVLVESGGDWDRRNRLKVYQGVYLLSIRDFKAGGQLLFDTISTFTATELLSYENFIALCIIAGVLTLSRKDLKTKIIESPEVISVLGQLPHLKDFTTALYETEYAKFFRALAEVEEYHLIPSRVLEKHARYYTKELRIKAYAQLLESYRSVTLQSLADAFGVGEAFLEAQVKRKVQFMSIR
jgi:26S proteasome regulatory subunit N7